ncbi:hypothetical protein MBH78_00680 [Oceanimonas sp. NS1]|nr:hypothetical protein [Oceanimonas sp. NS1]
MVIMSLLSAGLALYAPKLVSIWILGSAMLVCGVLVPAIAALLAKELNRTAGILAMWTGLGSAVGWQLIGQPFGIHPIFIGLPIALLLLPVILSPRQEKARA